METIDAVFLWIVGMAAFCLGLAIYDSWQKPPDPPKNKWKEN